MFSTSVTCPALTLENGRVTYDVSPGNERYPTGTISSFSCNDGYSLSVTMSRTCQISGNWDQETPLCVPSNEITSFLKVNIL